MIKHKSKLFASLTITALSACASQQPPTTVATNHDKPVATYAGLSAPAAVLYDAAQDRYLVANVNGGALTKDDNGFISVLSPDGQVVQPQWIAGGKNGAHLNAPKGLALQAGVLFVADIDVVRKFDATTGAPLATIEVPGSTYLKDLSAAPDGRVYLSDAGAPTGRFDAKGTEAIYVIENDKATLLSNGSTLGRPDGIAWTDKGLVVAPFGADSIYRLDDKGAKRDVTKLPAGGLGGVITLGDTVLVSSWQTSTIYRGKLGGEFEVALADQKSPADIGYDTKRSRVLVPHFTEDSVEAFELK